MSAAGRRYRRCEPPNHSSPPSPVRVTRAPLRLPSRRNPRPDVRFGKFGKSLNCRTWAARSTSLGGVDSSRLSATPHFAATAFMYSLSSHERPGNTCENDSNRSHPAVSILLKNLRDAYDRRRIEAATQVRRDQARGAQSAPYGFLEDGEEVVRILVVISVTDFAGGVEVIVASGYEPVAADDQEMRRQELVDGTIESRFRAVGPAGEVFANHLFIRLAWDVAVKELMQLGAADEFLADPHGRRTASFRSGRERR